MATPSCGRLTGCSHTLLSSLDASRPGRFPGGGRRVGWARCSRPDFRARGDARDSHEIHVRCCKNVFLTPRTLRVRAAPRPRRPKHTWAAPDLLGRRATGKSSRNASQIISDEPSPTGVASPGSTGVLTGVDRTGSQSASSSGAALMRVNSSGAKKPSSPMSQEAKNAKLATGSRPAASSAGAFGRNSLKTCASQLFRHSGAGRTAAPEPAPAPTGHPPRVFTRPLTLSRSAARRHSQGFSSATSRSAGMP